jgi:hypothetical protein
LTDVRKRHLKQLIGELEMKKAKVQGVGGEWMPGDKPLSSATVRNVMALVSALLGDAEDEELIELAPRLRRGALPAKGDDDPTWRETAIFNASEVETLISDPFRSTGASATRSSSSAVRASARERRCVC